MIVANAVGEEDSRAALLKTFFPLSENKQAVGTAWWERVTSSRQDRSPLLNGEGVQLQLAAAMRFLGGEYREEGSYDRLSEIKIPTLVANGNNDVLVPTHNSCVL